MLAEGRPSCRLLMIVEGIHFGSHWARADTAQRLLKSAKIERVDLLMPTDSRMLQAQPAAGRSGVGSPARASLLPTLLPRNAVGQPRIRKLEHRWILEVGAIAVIGAIIAALMWLLFR